ncbi:hypothetical protein [Arabiibacter massiliensis]|uniref:hypothetical protein n=1 Tax=Arabiibacter massiliensis TaxID=1870985 RepID=UPI00117A2705|nr:hypothetical protein [Arabiibacter massiliensis]
MAHVGLHGVRRYPQFKRGRGSIVEERRGGAEAPDASSGDAVLAEGIRQCLELGMTLDDVEKRFQRALEGFRTDDGE